MALALYARRRRIAKWFDGSRRLQMRGMRSVRGIEARLLRQANLGGIDRNEAVAIMLASRREMRSKGFLDYRIHSPRGSVFAVTLAFILACYVLTLVLPMPWLVLCPIVAFLGARFIPPWLGGYTRK